MSRGFVESTSTGKSPSDDTSTTSQSSALESSSRRDVEFCSMVNEAECDLALSRNDIRKSKSKVRSYFKRCKDVLYGHSSDDVANITVKRDIPHSSNTSRWYLTAEMQDDVSGDRISIDQMPAEMKENQIKEQEASDCNELMVPLAESQVNKVKLSYKR